MTQAELTNNISNLEEEREKVSIYLNRLNEKIKGSTDEDGRERLMKYRTFVHSKSSATEKALIAFRLMLRAEEGIFEYFNCQTKEVKES